MEHLQLLLEYLKAFYYIKNTAEFDNKSIYAKLKKGDYKIETHITKNNISESQNDYELITIRYDDNLYKIGPYSFEYNYGMISNFSHHSKPVIKSLLAIFIFLLNLQSPIKTGNYCKEQTMPDSEQIHSMLFSVDNYTDTTTIEVQKSLSEDSDITHKYSGKYTLDENNNIINFTIYIEDEHFNAIIKLNSV